MHSVQQNNATYRSLPAHARVVIIGGGVIGCSVAYHFAKLGWRDVVLLERSRLTCGTTWHAAGLIVSGFSSETEIYIAKYTRDLYERLADETGQDTGFYANGYMQIASNLERLESLRRRADYCRAHGVNTEEISASEIKHMWPLFHTQDILAGFFTAGSHQLCLAHIEFILPRGQLAHISLVWRTWNLAPHPQSSIFPGSNSDLSFDLGIMTQGTHVAIQYLSSF